MCTILVLEQGENLREVSQECQGARDGVQTLNKVNEKLGKPLFSCTIEALAEKWGSCGCFDLPGKNASSASLAVTQ